MAQHANKNPQGDQPEANPAAGFRPPAVAMIRKALAQDKVLCVRIIGHPGAGKTSLIESTLKRLPAPQRVGVIVVNPASSRDADRLRKSCGFVAHVDAAIPTAAEIWRVISELQLNHFDAILIETAGGLAPLQDLGQDATVAVFATSGGDDKAAEYHDLLGVASAVILTKIDLRPLVQFDSQLFRGDIQSINPSAQLYEISTQTGSGLSDWIAWTERARLAKLNQKSQRGPNDTPSSNYFG